MLKQCGRPYSGNTQANGYGSRILMPFNTATSGFNCTQLYAVVTVQFADLYKYNELLYFTEVFIQHKIQRCTTYNSLKCVNKKISPCLLLLDMSMQPSNFTSKTSNLNIRTLP